MDRFYRLVCCLFGKTNCSGFGQRLVISGDNGKKMLKSLVRPMTRFFRFPDGKNGLVTSQIMLSLYNKFYKTMDFFHNEKSLKCTKLTIFLHLLE